MKTLLYLSDLYYKAQGRIYAQEDLYITEQLKKFYNILLVHPQQALPHLEYADLIVLRNTGPAMYYWEDFLALKREINRLKKPSFNSMDGKADMQGKAYLLELSQAAYPVTPSVDRLENIQDLGPHSKYVLKPQDSADSIGLEVLTLEELAQREIEHHLIQPYLDFEYEVSFYYLNDQFQYALYAPNTSKRWDLKEYGLQKGDLEFCQHFLDWNPMAQGIQRVDAARLRDGSLLLVELEDLNPFLSLELLEEHQRKSFIAQLHQALTSLLP